MSNGTDINGTNPLSPYIRPGLAIVFGVVLGFLVVIGFTEALRVDQWGIALGLLAIIAIPPFWYFNIRTGDKTVTKMLEMFQIGTKAGNGTLPKVDSGSTTSTVEGVEPVVEEQPKYVTWDGKPPIPFDRDFFMTEVMRDVEGQMTEVNNFTIFAEAQTKLEGVSASWTFNNTDAYWASRELLFELVGNAFREKWGVSYEDAITHLNDPAGCTTCKASTCTYPDIDFKARLLGMDYYFILRQYRDYKSQLEAR